MVLSLEQVAVAYDGSRAVAGVSLRIDEGETVALLGPSGSGKSSLLRAIAGLEPLASGWIRWAGEDLAGIAVHRRGFGLLFQDGQLFAHRDVARNVAYGLESARMPRAQRAGRVSEMLELVGLAGFGDRDIATLSGGQRQRVALARALAPRPRLLLLDEPLSALDRGLRERLANDIRDVLQATGTTAVYVTHDQDEAFAVADRVGVLLPESDGDGVGVGDAVGVGVGVGVGRLVRVAAPADLWSHPERRDVADFLGYQAFLGALAVSRDGLRVRPAESDEQAVATGVVAGARLRAGRIELAVDADPGSGLDLASETEHLTALPAAGALPAVGSRVALILDRAACAPLRS